MDDVALVVATEADFDAWLPQFQSLPEPCGGYSWVLSELYALSWRFWVGCRHPEMSDGRIVQPDGWKDAKDGICVGAPAMVEVVNGIGFQEFSAGRCWHFEAATFINRVATGIKAASRTDAPSHYAEVLTANMALLTPPPAADLLNGLMVECRATSTARMWRFLENERRKPSGAVALLESLRENVAPRIMAFGAPTALKTKPTRGRKVNEKRRRIYQFARQWRLENPCASWSDTHAACGSKFSSVGNENLPTIRALMRGVSRVAAESAVCDTTDLASTPEGRRIPPSSGGAKADRKKSKKKSSSNSRT